MSKFNGAPYLSDYNPDKCFTNVLAVPGRVVQAREVTEVGEIALDFLGRLGDAVLNNGAVIEGCVPNVTGNRVTLTAGLIYLDGLVRIYDGSGYVDITGEGVEWVGVRLNQEIVTYETDPALLDPALGYENGGSAGADRCKETVLWGMGDDYVRVYQFIDGVLVTEQPAENSELMEILARRTFDENGSYRVKGLQIGKKVDRYGKPVKGVNEESDEEDRWKIVVTSGKAYVRGWENERLSDTTLDLPFVDSSGSALSSFEYRADQTYEVNRIPLIDVISLTGECIVGDQAVLRGAAASDGVVANLINVSSDYKERLSCREVRGVYRKVGEELVPVPSEYWSYSNGRITWQSTASSIVNEGSTYYVDVTFSVTYKEDIDFEKYSHDDIFVGVKFLTGCQFPPSDQGNKAILDLNYKFRYSRIDMVLITRDNELKIVEGVPTLAEKLAYPVNQDIDRLVLGYAIQANNGLVIENVLNYRLTQDELNTVRDEVGILKTNVAMTDLDREAEYSDPAEDLNGIYTDGFLNYYKFDLANTGYSKYTEGGQERSEICSIDYATNELTLPVIEQFIDASVKSGDDNVPGVTWGRVISAAALVETVINQPRATDDINVNPYAAVGPLCLVQVDPPVDSWVETDYKVVNEVVTNTVNITVEDTKRRSSVTNVRGNAGTYQRTETSTSTSTSTSESSRTVREDSLIEYMRQIELTVKGEAFPPNIPGFYVYFDGEKIKEFVSAVDSETDGSGYQYLITDENGECSATFKIPAGHQCGTVRVEIVYEGDKNVLLDAVGVDEAKGFANYQSTGTLETYTTINTTTITNTITVTNTRVLTTVTFVNSSDPVAQSFSFDQTRLLTGVSLYFSQKYTAERYEGEPALIYKGGFSPVTIQIVGVTNGYPNNTVYATKILRPDQVNVSSNASAETLVVFDQPVLCEADKEYAIVVMSDTQAYKVWYAELGKTRVDPAGAGSKVLNQAYTGVMFTSANHSTWTAHQTWDLTFKVHCARFNGEAEVIFDSVSQEKFADVCLAIEAIDYASSGMVWYYTTDGGGHWYEITPGLKETMNTETQSSVGLKCRLRITNDTYTSMSPLLARDCVGLDFFFYRTLGEYISRYVTFDTDFNTVRVSVEVYIPGTNENAETASDPAKNGSSALAVAFRTEFDGTILIDSTETNKASAMVEANPTVEGVTGYLGNTYQRVIGYIQPENAAFSNSGVNTGLANSKNWRDGFLGEMVSVGYNWYRCTWYKHLGYTQTGEVVTWNKARGLRIALVLKGNQSYRTRARKLMVTTGWSTLKTA